LIFAKGFSIVMTYYILACGLYAAGLYCASTSAFLNRAGSRADSKYFLILWAVIDG